MNISDASFNLGNAPMVKKKRSLIARMNREKYYYLLILPGVLYLIIYKFFPLLGNVIAFQDYSPYLGFAKSKWVGFAHFKEIFNTREVVRVIWNTLYLFFIQTIFIFPTGIIFSLLLNEMRAAKYKRVLQSIIYLPHFLSWVAVISIMKIFLTYSGLLNKLLHFLFGIAPIYFLTKPGLFVPILTFQVMWKESGWGTILILSAIAGVNPNLYEAAIVDGASRWQRCWHITLPSIRSVVIILLILRMSSVLDSGFEQIYLMLTPFTKEVGNVLDTYVYFKGIQEGDFSFATAVGIFKGVVGLIMIILTNKLVKRFGQEGLY